MSGEAALPRDDAIDALYVCTERSMDRPGVSDGDARAMIAGVIDELWAGGFVLCRKEAQDEPPDWAEVIVNTLFTGAPLNFDGREIPPWLQVRLEAEYGHPYPARPPTGQRQQQPPEFDEDPPQVPPVPIWPTARRSES